MLPVSPTCTTKKHMMLFWPILFWRKRVLVTILHAMDPTRGFFRESLASFRILLGGLRLVSFVGGTKGANSFGKKFVFSTRVSKFKLFTELIYRCTLASVHFQECGGEWHPTEGSEEKAPGRGFRSPLAVGPRGCSRLWWLSPQLRYNPMSRCT